MFGSGLRLGTIAVPALLALLCDDVLRSGSGNWSVSAARYQDNEITVTTDAAEVAVFEREFRAMWERPDNMRVR